MLKDMLRSAQSSLKTKELEAHRYKKKAKVYDQTISSLTTNKEESLSKGRRTDIRIRKKSPFKERKEKRKKEKTIELQEQVVQEQVLVTENTVEDQPSIDQVDAPSIDHIQDTLQEEEVIEEPDNTGVEEQKVEEEVEEQE